MTLFLTLFIAGVLTILLPCILPLIPIVLGVSISGRSPWRPLLIIAGMLVSFVGFTFLLLVVLSQFVEVADYIRIATYDILLLFGLGFLTHRRSFQYTGALLGGLFFLNKGITPVLVAALSGVLAMELGGKVAARMQQLGIDIQGKTRGEFGSDSPITAFIIGLTLGLVWVPCAGPALGFAFTLVREEPGLRAAALLFAYGLGTAVPLLLVGYGGQWAVGAVRSVSRYSEYVKRMAGVLLIMTALGLQFRLFEKAQVWLLTNTNFGDLGTRLEERLFEGKGIKETPLRPSGVYPERSRGEEQIKEVEEIRGTGEVEGTEEVDPTSPSPLQESAELRGAGEIEEDEEVQLPKLPKLVRAPELAGLGPWHNSDPFTLQEMRGKVVLVDFWTYSCINCIRTLPYIQGYWEKFGSPFDSAPVQGLRALQGLERQGDTIGPFVVIGVHSPEFVFEKSERNVADAIRRHGLTYPVAQDNDFETWRAFSNHYWPAKYLIDAEGYIRYTHFGEGAYEETERAIRSLLAEIGVQMKMGEEGTLRQAQGDVAVRRQTPEIYLGERSWKALGNAQGKPTSEGVSYPPPEELDLHTYALVGDWQLVDGEHQTLRGAEGEIRMKFLGGEINLVLGLEKGGDDPVQAEVEVNGRPWKTFTIDHHDLYNLFKGRYGEHDVVLKLHGKGVEGYAFTFGS